MKEGEKYYQIISIPIFFATLVWCVLNSEWGQLGILLFVYAGVGVLYERRKQGGDE